MGSKVELDFISDTLKRPLLMEESNLCWNSWRYKICVNWTCGTASFFGFFLKKEMEHVPVSIFLHFCGILCQLTFCKFMQDCELCSCLTSSKHSHKSDFLLSKVNSALILPHFKETTFPNPVLNLWWPAQLQWKSYHSKSHESAQFISPNKLVHLNKPLWKIVSEQEL